MNELMVYRGALIPLALKNGSFNTGYAPTVPHSILKNKALIIQGAARNQGFVFL
jgi:molybdate-binding protein